MLVLTRAAQIAVLAALGLASPVAEKHAPGFALVKGRAKQPMHTRSASGEKIFDKQRALSEKSRIVKKYTKPNGYAKSSSTLFKRYETVTEPFDVNTLRRRAVSGTVALTDDYDGIDECESLLLALSGAWSNSDFSVLWPYLYCHASPRDHG